MNAIVNNNLELHRSAWTILSNVTDAETRAYLAASHDAGGGLVLCPDEIDDNYPRFALELIESSGKTGFYNDVDQRDEVRALVLDDELLLKFTTNDAVDLEQLSSLCYPDCVYRMLRHRLDLQTCIFNIMRSEFSDADLSAHLSFHFRTSNIVADEDREALQEHSQIYFSNSDLAVDNFPTWDMCRQELLSCCNEDWRREWEPFVS